MVNAASALRRGLLVTSLSIALLAVIAGFTLVTNAHGQEILSPVAPSTVGDVWSPASGTAITFYTSSSLQVVVTLTKSSTYTFDLNSARFNVVEPTGQTEYPATASLLGGNTVVMTATGFQAHTTGDRIQFLISYTDAPGYSSSAIYPITILEHQVYIPLVQSSPDGSDPCRAFPAEPLTPYTIAQDQPYRFFSLTVPVTSTVFVTASNYALTGQMQVRVPPGASCVTTGTQYLLNYANLPAVPTLKTYNLVPGNYLVRFSADTTSTTPFTFMWSYSPGQGPLEVNNTTCTAAQVTPGVAYKAYPDDAVDFYYFDSSLVNATIQITVAGFNIPGQYQLIKGNSLDCSTFDWPPVKVATASSGIVTMTATSQPVGRYLLRVLTTNQNGFNQSQLYSFRVGIGTGLLMDSTSATPDKPAPSPIPMPTDGVFPILPPEDFPKSDQSPAP